MAIILAREQSGMTERTSSIRDSTIALLDDNDDQSFQENSGTYFDSYSNRS